MTVGGQGRCVDGLDGDEVCFADQRGMSRLGGDDPLVGEASPLYIVESGDPVSRAEAVVVGGLSVPDLPPGVAGVGENRCDGGRRPGVAEAVWVAVAVCL